MGDDTKPTSSRDAARRRRASRGQAKELAEVLPLMPADAKERRRKKREVPEGGADNEKDTRTRMRINLGKRWTEIVRGVKAGEYTWQEFCEGLDPEELARAQLKDKNGHFVGRPPTLVPREFHLECQRELRRRFDEKMQSRLLAATDEYIKLSADVEEPALREKMLRYVMERVMGPIPKTVELSTAPKFEGVLAAVIRGGGEVDRSHRYNKRVDPIEDDYDPEEEDQP